MICLNCDRIRMLMKKQSLTIEDLNERCHNSINKNKKLYSIIYQNYMTFDHYNKIPYDLSLIFNVSTDYLLGFHDDETIPAIDLGNDYQSIHNRFVELSKVILRDCDYRDIDKYNTNILANMCELDRDIFDLLLKRDVTASWFIVPSYYIVFKISRGLDSDFITMMRYLLNAEVDTVGKNMLDIYTKKYNDEKYLYDREYDYKGEIIRYKPLLRNDVRIYDETTLH